MGRPHLGIDRYLGRHRYDCRCRTLRQCNPFFRQKLPILVFDSGPVQDSQLHRTIFFVRTGLDLHLLIIEQLPDDVFETAPIVHHDLLPNAGRDNGHMHGEEGVFAQGHRLVRIHAGHRIGPEHFLQQPSQFPNIVGALCTRSRQLALLPVYSQIRPTRHSENS